MKISKIDKKYLIELDSKIYNFDVLHKCFYWYLGEYEVEINEKDLNTNLVIIRLNYETTDSESESFVKKIRQDLIDFKTRDIISKETKNIRDLLVAKAFAHSDEFDTPAKFSLSQDVE